MAPFCQGGTEGHRRALDSQDQSLGKTTRHRSGGAKLANLTYCFDRSPFMKSEWLFHKCAPHRKIARIGPRRSHVFFKSPRRPNWPIVLFQTMAA